MHFFNTNDPLGKIKLSEFAALSKKHGIPALNDIAADVPPLDNLSRSIKLGYDLVTVSGGKGLHGPQSCGLLLGRSDLIKAARLNGPPNSDAIGRAGQLARWGSTRSILDSVKEAVAALERRLGAGDRVKVAEYLDAMREIERRIQVTERLSGESVLALPDRPIGVPESYDEHAKLMFDLAALAFQADITRVFTLLLGREQTNRPYPFLGVPEAHHSISHHQNDPVKLAKAARINTYHIELLARFAGRLRSLPDGDGTLLDHSMILQGSGLSNSDQHSHIDLPLVLVGGAAGRLKGGRHLRFPKDTPMNNLHLAMLEKVGINVEKLGDSSGRIELEPLAGV